jgi:DNA repair exonuclease SbcCD ATPase subunit/DNA repair exonuclease SbcCD nuclease subunit
MIAHFADLHIGSAPLGARSDEYRLVFDKVSAALLRARTGSAAALAGCVIAGDIFHHKTKYSGADVADFDYLMKKLADYPVLIVPGNHDCLPNHDLLEPLVGRYPNVIYVKNTARFEFAGRKFYHLSFLDADDQPSLPPTPEDAAERVLVYHGMVDGSTFGKHVERGHPVNADYLAKFKMTMLGDIHQYQVILPGRAKAPAAGVDSPVSTHPQEFVRGCAVYPGSLIQQNVSESHDKGFVLYNPDLSHRRVLVDNPKKFVRVDLRGKSAEEIQRVKVAPGDLLKVTLITDSANYEQQIEQVRKIYGRIDSSTVVPGVTTRLAGDVADILRAELSRAAASEQTIAYITDDFLRRIGTSVYRKWTVKTMRWSNLLAYGENNHLDFDALRGVSGVIAPNHTGKSSIIDILVYGLFGEPIRGVRTNMLNAHSPAGYVEVVFESNGARYKITRRDTRAKHSTVALECAGANLSGTTITETYKRVRGYVGTKEQLLLTGVYYNERCDLVIGMESAERIRVLSELLGLTAIGEIVTELKPRISNLKKAMAALKRPASDDPAAESALAQAALAASKKAVETLAAEHTAARTALDAAVSGAELKSAAELLAERQECARVRVRAEEALDALQPVLPAPECRAPGVRLDQALADYHKLLRPEYRPEGARDPPGDRGAVDPALVTEKYIDSLVYEKNRLSLVVPKNPGSFDYSPEAKLVATASKKITRAAPPTQTRETIVGSLAAARAELAAAEARSDDHERRRAAATAASAAVARARGNTRLGFSAECACCQENKQTLAADLAAAERAYEASRVDDIADELLRARENAATRRSVLEGELAAWAEYITAERDYHAAEAARVALSNFLRAREDYEEKLAAYNGYLTGQGAGLAALSKLIPAAELVKSAYAYSCYVKYTNWSAAKSTLEATVAKCKSAEAVLSERISRVPTVDIQAMKKRVADLAADLAAATRALGHAEAEATRARADQALAAAHTAAYTPLAEELRRLSIYLELVRGDQLRMGIIGKNMDRLLITTNSLLERMGYRITADTSAGLDFQLVDESGEVPLCMASKFQLFSVALALRLALVMSLPVCPEFVMIDEGFGSSDRTKLARVGELLALLAPNYKFLFIISHNEELQSSLDTPIYISRRVAGSATFSSLVYGEVVEKVKKPVAVDKVESTLVCECGAVIARGSRYNHVRTRKHIDAMAKKNENA